MSRLPVSIPALAAGALAAVPARAEPLPLRIDYQAAPGCPGEEGFLDEIRWRTSLARVAAPGAEALPVRARITRRGAVHEGRLVLGAGRDRVERTIEGEVCDEVVSALALVTALAVDPKASMAKRRPSPPAAPPAPVPPAAPFEPPDASRVAERLPLPEIVGPPLPVVPAPAEARRAPEPRERLWSLGARASAAFAVTAQPLYAGGIAVERAFAGSVGASLRLVVEVGGTGAFDAGPGRVSFVRATGRLTGCVFTLRPTRWLSFVPCLAVEGGALRGQGLAGGSLTRVEEATVPWVGAAALPRVAVDLGPVVLDLEGGPVFPLVRRTFVFDTPGYVIHDLPPVTAMIGLGGGVRFP